jgi:MFS family permease
MMKVLKLPLSSVIFFGIFSQLISIVFIKMWGRYTDRFSNKTIIHIAAPLYICCILSWSFVGLASTKAMVVLLVALLNIISGMATAGINLAIGNIGIKLASKDEAIVYFSARSVVVALISFTGPMLGGFLADFFAKRSLSWSFEWNGPQGKTIFPLLNLHGWNFLFIVGGVLAFLSTYLLKKVKEEGEVEKRLAVAEMRVVFRKNVKNRMTKKAFLSLLVSPVVYPLTLKKRIERKVIMMRRHNKDVGMKTA